MTSINSVNISPLSVAPRAEEYLNGAKPQYIQMLTKTANRDFTLHIPPQSDDKTQQSRA